MKNKLIVLSGVVLMGLAPVVTFAQQATGVTVKCSAVNAQSGTLQYIICKIGDLINLVVPILLALGVVYFVWGIISFVIAGDEEAKKAGRDKIIYGIIGLAVIVAVWGLVGILVNTFGVDTSTRVINLPTTPY
ncbi:MAG: pilin [bacterium]